MTRVLAEVEVAEGSAREILALNLIAIRQRLGLSQENLAMEAGLHRTFVAHVERHARNISLDNIEKLARALQVPVFELLTTPAIRRKAVRK